MPNNKKFIKINLKDIFLDDIISPKKLKPYSPKQLLKVKTNKK